MKLYKSLHRSKERHRHSHHVSRPRKYVLQKDLFYHLNGLGIVGYEYEDKDIRIRSNGHITVYSGYESDGNTPKLNTPFGAYGVPDGPVQKDGLPISARAFIIHDALLDTGHHHGIAIQKVHQAYAYEIRKTTWIFKRLYAYMVVKFGPRKYRHA